MIINLVSDLHLDISGAQELPGGDVLILAGDICEAKELGKEFHSTKVLPYSGGSFPCYDFFEFELAKYKKVFYVLGNHEHYRGKFWKTKSELERVLPKNVTVLENQCEVYEGVLFIGATLWTDMNKGDPMTLHSMQHYMNDYKAITFSYPQYNAYHKMRPMDTVKMHYESKRYIEEKVIEHADLPVVVITHMAPTFMSVNDKYKGELSNGAYASDLSDLILDHTNIKFFCHGHMHDPCDYMVGNTRVICNPRGYLPCEEDNGFDPNFTFEVCP
jgi:Icc-related predicted phosphoesterase